MPQPGKVSSRVLERLIWLVVGPWINVVLVCFDMKKVDLPNVAPQVRFYMVLPSISDLHTLTKVT